MLIDSLEQEVLDHGFFGAEADAQELLLDGLSSWASELCGNGARYERVALDDATHVNHLSLKG